MSSSSKNRVASSKTTRGSLNPGWYAEYDGIVQPQSQTAQSTVTVEDVNRVIEVGKLLRAALTPAELEQLQVTRKTIDDILAMWISIATKT